MWVSAVDLDDGRVGMVSYVPLHGGRAPFRPITAASGAPAPGRVVLGTLDGEWRITRVSQDVEEMLGFSSEELRGAPALGVLHPADVAGFLAAVELARLGHRTVQVVVRVRAKSGDWRPVTAALATLTDDYPPALAFAMVARTAHDEPATVSDVGQSSRFDADLLRVAGEVRAAGIVSRIADLSDPAQFPYLPHLTTREWEILARLLDGERVPLIAADLFVSQSTVRNHLSSIFAKFGVHSQAELIRRLRST